MKKLLIISACVLINITSFAAEEGKASTNEMLLTQSPEMVVAVAIHKFAESIRRKFDEGGEFLKVHSYRPNRYYGKTKTLILKYDWEGLPWQLYTPQGLVTIFGDHCMSDTAKYVVKDSFLEKMILKPVKANRYCFSIVSFEGIKLPDAKKLDEGLFREYKAVTESCKTMMEQYKKEEKKELN